MSWQVASSWKRALCPGLPSASGVRVGPGRRGACRLAVAGGGVACSRLVVLVARRSGVSFALPAFVPACFVAELALSKGREDLAKAALVEREKAAEMAEGLTAEIGQIECPKIVKQHSRPGHGNEGDRHFRNRKRAAQSLVPPGR